MDFYGLLLVFLMGGVFGWQLLSYVFMVHLQAHFILLCSASIICEVVLVLMCGPVT